MDQATILEVLRATPGRSRSLKEIIQHGKLPAGDLKSLKRLLKGMVGEGTIERELGRRYRLSREGQLAEGLVRVSEGHALFVPSGKDQVAVRLLLEPGIDVQEGERVRAAFERVGKKGRVVAKLVEVLTRPMVREVGIFRRVGKAIFIEPEPRKDRLGTTSPVLIPEDEAQSVADGVLVEFQVTRPATGTRGPAGTIVRVIGRPGDRPTEVARLMIEHGLPTAFPPEVEAQARSFGHTVDPAEIARRRDLRNIDLVTIDGETARDFDDAVCAELNGKAGFKLYVAIADVSYYVRADSPLDKEALRRGTSTYLTDRAIPMLPEALSNELCSLKPHVDRLCLVAELMIDKSGRVQSSDFYRAVMRSRARLTYTRVAAALLGEPDAECRALLPGLLRLSKVASLLLERRLLRGAIDLDLPESEIIHDIEGFPIDVVRRPRNDAHRLIEDLMLAANEAVAAYFEDRDLPTIFRIHEDPDPERLQAFLELCRRLGLPVKLKKKVHPKDVALLLETLAEHPVGRSLHALLLRTLAQARYYPENEGHFGLAAERYLHFTSPIRRYPDLMVHRLLTAAVSGEAGGYSPSDLAQVAELSSAAERRAALAERGSKDLDRAYVAARHIGERLPATVTSIQSFGIFAAADNPFVEGLIPIQGLGDDYFEPDEYGAFMRGKYSGKELHLGMPIEVEIASVNISRRQVDLRLVGQEPIPITGAAHGRLVLRRQKKQTEDESGDGRPRRPAWSTRGALPARPERPAGDGHAHPRGRSSSGKPKGRKQGGRGGRGGRGGGRRG